MQNMLRTARENARDRSGDAHPRRARNAPRATSNASCSTNNIYVRPVPGPVTQWYGAAPGIDIAPPYGTPIGAAHSGIVTFVGWDDGYGMHVEVAQADGYVTTYSHMSAWTVKVGQLVDRRASSSETSAAPATRPARTCTSRSTCPNGQRMDPAIWLFEHGVAVMTPSARLGLLELLHRRVAQQQLLHADVAAEVDARPGLVGRRRWWRRRCRAPTPNA